MFQIYVRGKIVDVVKRQHHHGRKPTATVTVEVRVWRQGTQQFQYVQCVFDEYWTERFLKLDDKTKYMTVRGSDMHATHEPSAGDDGTVYMWLKAEEFFL